MLNILFDNPLVFLITTVGLLLSLTIHEFAHAFMADRLGDPTPRHQGRLTLNPLAHLDPLGTVLLLLTHFGWGKPVQFDPHNLKNPLQDGALVAAAGPAMNLLVAFLLSLLLRFHVVTGPLLSFALAQIIFINIGLALFNLIPVHPLDGSKVILAVLPRQLAYEYENFMGQFGYFVLLALILPLFNGVAPVSLLLSPAITFLAHLLFS
jgi:Zn-dependent protease